MGLQCKPVGKLASIHRKMENKKQQSKETNKKGK